MSVTYEWTAELINNKGQSILAVTGESVEKIMGAEIGPFAMATEKVNVSLTRYKDGAEPATVRIVKDSETGEVKPLGRFSAHNTNVPVTKLREIAAVV